ncbi:MAG: hypothetical protein GY866_26705 [Proteobacteria bacterium]|nr:hypothetical protein [Pseudomonadota bacterium]
MVSKIRVKSKYTLFFMFLGLSVWLQGCNYNYYRGLQLEEEGRYEEANIEFHRAYNRSPNTLKYQDAYLRTAVKTTEDLLNRYDRYVKEKKYFLAFRRLEQAQALTPDHPKIDREIKKWYRILVAGRVDLAQIKSLHNQIPLTDQIILEVRINTPNITRRLEAPVDYQTNTFNVEDILYDPPQNLLMMYSLNSIGVKLVDNITGRERFKKFVDFRTPVLVDVQGSLKASNPQLTSIDQFYPIEHLENDREKQYWYPSRGIRYMLKLDEKRIKVNSSVKHIDFLPQILYMNKKDRRYFLDFGHFQLSQKKTGGLWSFRRHISKNREYMLDLKKNLMLNPYFYFREGGYPFVSSENEGNG